MIWLLICLVIKNVNLIVTELFIRGRKLNTFLVFITQSYFAVPENTRLSSTHYFVMKIPNKIELQQVASDSFNHSSDIDFQGFMNLYKKFTVEPYAFLVIDTTFPWDNSLRFKSLRFNSFTKESFRNNIKVNHDNW